MVTSHVTPYELKAKWIGYFVLSIGINGLIVYNLALGLPAALPAQVNRLSVKLKTMVLPTMPAQAVQPVQTKPQRQRNSAATKQRIAKPAVVTQKAQESVTEIKTDASDTSTAKQHLRDTVDIAQAPALATQPMSEITPESEFVPIQAMAGDIVKESESVETVSPSTILTDKPLASAMIHEAKYRKKTAPIYPVRALELGQQGMVLLHAKVLPSGQPSEIKIVDSSGYRLLDQAALAAVKQWEFVPTNMNGHAMVSWVSVPVNFIIQ